MFTLHGLKGLVRFVFLLSLAVVLLNADEHDHIVRANLYIKSSCSRNTDVIFCFV